MIGVDTNVLVRYLTADDAAQARRVHAFLLDAMDEGESLRIDEVVLCEVVWVLRGAFRLGKAAIVDALEKVLSTALFSFDDRELLRTALDDYRFGPGDYADYVIGRRNAKARCAHTVTFNQPLRGHVAFILL